ncbi:MAG: DUF1697 domain-containing protein [Anaerolineae bacterium]|nr:DUF1697 domain-containing protein [Anaerolineae bacterium]RIK20134.1 MAG: DUF1697 domain-containing protein [Anaerolineae bacterium]
MKTYALLLRGINVGGKNKVPMAALKQILAELGFAEIRTYIASGNVVLKSDKLQGEIQNLVEAALPAAFTLDSELVKVLVLSHNQFQRVIADKPDGFGDQPDKYHSDAIFLMDVAVADAMAAFNPREGVDMIWPGNGVIYSQRLSAERTKSRLNTIMASPLYKSMTIRNWNTTVNVMDIMDSVAGGHP